MARKSFKGTRLNDADYSGTAFDDQIVERLLDGATIGCNMSELALYANVSRSSLYSFLSKNPDIKDKIDTLRHDTALQARRTVRQSIIDGDEITAKWYLERKVKDEFTAKTDIDIQSDQTLTIEDKEETLKSFLNRFRSSETD